ncbi:MAG: xanthine dehydrogenase family protein molybdopterin-binding subunit, partial [Proteobacteria bacterium]
MMETGYTGQARSRVDGPAKVRGQAAYAAEYSDETLAYGYVVSAAIAKGSIRSFDFSAAEKVPGLISIYSHKNRPEGSTWARKYTDDDAPEVGKPFRPFLNNKIIYSGQPIALVIAESFEAAREAALLIRVEYDVEKHETDLLNFVGRGTEPKKNRNPLPKNRGNAKKALAKAAFTVIADYSSPSEHHNPMEMHASSVLYDKKSDSLTIYDKTQGVLNSQTYVCEAFGLSKDKVRIVSPYVGGAFGSGLRPQYQLFLAVMASLDLKRSIKIVLTRQQMFSFGHRPKTLHKVSLGADKDGCLVSVTHEALAETSQYEEYTENVVAWSGEMYQCDNVSFDYKLAKLDVYTPLDMRAPGAALGMYAFESAIDELAVESGIDPLAFRLKNYAEIDQNKNLKYSSKELRECYRQGAEAFGWDRRPLLPRSMKEGHEQIGWGMASGVWEAQQNKASAKATLMSDGRLEVSSATSDIGTGTYTIMTQIAAEALGLSLE